MVFLNIYFIFFYKNIKKARKDVCRTKLQNTDIRLKSSVSGAYNIVTT